jgi:peptidyl-prolyl cis-trans isomerase A (cyclophilin A)/peptidyl-prolyl cis-trans isomerase B (cyclophilin B)
MNNKILVLAAMIAMSACGRKEAAEPVPPEAAAPQSEAASVATEEEAAVAPQPPTEPIETRADEFAWPASTGRAKIITSRGDITIELYADKAPKTVENFLQYARDGHYDRLVFHRVVAGFVVQGGGYNQYLAERPTRDPIPYEGDNGLPNLRSTLSMARTMDPNSAASQFFINLRDNDQLDHFVNDLGPRYGYAVFGRVIEGMEIVDAIGAVATGPGGPFEAEVPAQPIIIVRVDPLPTE